ncbi:TIR domain-containing protein [Streptomyces goshikiensis]|uniref:toll/interleukin-1 receptor domain-containing protein n=1 Tax=Streptomyces goshikiensis TaxID=1942 RepID=UPI00369629C9|nr:TIR domain-containing protein [Streptomyces goshikiensis]
MERDAFISYSHRFDKELAQALQRGLHTLARPWTRRQVIHVFRDTTSLAANSDLDGAIRLELERSRHFIYLASPTAAESPWVREEIRFWIENRPMDRFFIAVSDGSVAWDKETGDFDWSRTTALPQILSGTFRKEPLWVDFTEIRRGRQFSLRRAEFRDAVATLAAPLHGRTKDSLDSEDLRQRRTALRMLRGAVAALSLLLVVALIAGVIAWQQRDEAVARSRTSASQALAARAIEMAASDPGKAAQFALYADQVERTGESARALAGAVSSNDGVARHLQGGSDQVALNRGAGTVPITKLKISPDGSTLAYYSNPGDEMYVYDIRTGQRSATLPTNGPQSGGALGLSANGRILVVETAFNVVQIWDVPRSKLVRTITAGDGKPLSNAFKRLQSSALSGDGRWFAATYYTSDQEEQHLAVWDTSSGNRTVEAGTGSDALSLAFGTDNRLVALSRDTGTLRTLAPDTGAWSGPRSLPGFPTGPAARGVALSEDGTRAYTVTSEKGGKDTLWDLVRGQRVAELGEAELTPTLSTGVQAITLTDRGSAMTVAGDGVEVAVYDSALGHRRTLGSFGWPVISIAASADGKWVVAASEDGAITLFAATSYKAGTALPNEQRLKAGELTRDGQMGFRSAEGTTELWTVDGGSSGVRRLGRIPRAVPEFGQLVATASLDGTRVLLAAEDGLSLWDPRTEQQIGSSMSFDERYAALSEKRPLAFMPDGIHAVAAWNKKLRLIDTRSWEVGQDLGEYNDDIDSMALTPDHGTLAATDGAQVTVWRWDGNNLLQQVSGKSTAAVPHSLAISPTGQKAAVIDKDRRITILDVTTGRLTRNRSLIQNGELAVRFSQDSSVLVQSLSSATETGLQFWSATTGDPLGSWNLGLGTPGEERSWRVLTGRDGAVLTLTKDGALVRRNIGLTPWHAALCALAPDPLPEDERNRYLKDLQVEAPCHP